MEETYWIKPIPVPMSDLSCFKLILHLMFAKGWESNKPRVPLVTQGSAWYLKCLHKSKIWSKGMKQLTEVFPPPRLQFNLKWVCLNKALSVQETWPRLIKSSALTCRPWRYISSPLESQTCHRWLGNFLWSSVCHRSASSSLLLSPPRNPPWLAHACGR